MPHQKSKVLLVEDEELVRQLLARVLTDAGFIVEEAANGAAALQAARRLDGALSVIITDINMPVMDGLEFARVLRVTDAKVPFLFITACMDPAVLNGIRPPAQLLTKPFTPDAFLEAVVELTKRAAGPGQPA
jgi:two-component system cell cycle sensor histidine kinase/response regulator CckA